MQVRHLSLQNYRNYADAEISFGPGLNMLVGRNGQGKTNVVEALMYLATLRSHRTAQDSALIRIHHDAAVIRAKLVQGEREALLELQLNRNSANKAQINRHSVRTRELTQLISGVLFAPEDLNIVRGEPAIRRRFLDDALISRHPVAAGAISDYDRVLRQRNALLRDARNSRSSSGVEAILDVWDEQLVELGSQIIAHRRMLVCDLSEPVGSSYFALVGEDHLPTLRLEESIFAQPDVSRETSTRQMQESVSRETIASAFSAALREIRGRELERGQTLIGPHRDELALSLKGLPVKGYASHGETWSYVLSLKLALAKVLREDSRTGDPIVILDDVFAELDEGRRAKLFHAISEFEQVIVTAAVESDVPAHSDWSKTRIHAGEVIDDV